MSNTASLKRKAHKLVQKKAYTEAAEEYAKLAEAGELDPYDFVIYGDLLLRMGDQLGAVERYMEALESYATSGLNRSAIALAKKVTRLAPQKLSVHKRLGDLYAQEGLTTEACTHYMDFLDRVDPSADDGPDSIEDAGLKLLALNLPSFALVDRIVAAAQAVERGVALAPAVFHQATQAAALGDMVNQERLTQLALSMDPDLDSGVIPSNGLQELCAESEYLDPGAVHFDTQTSDNGAADEGPVLSLDELETPEQTDFGMVSLDDASPSVAMEDSDHDGMAIPELSLPDDADEDTPELLVTEITLDDDTAESYEELAAQLEATSNAARPVAESGTPELHEVHASDVDDPLSVDETGDPDELLEKALEYVDRGEPSHAQREYMRAARAYWRDGRSREASDLYQRVVKMDPNHMDALRGLVEIAHINGEKSKMAHWGCELGDVLLARGLYPEAKLQFEQVLAFDSDNPKALARVARLRNVDGVEDVNFGDLRPARSEVQGARVDVKGGKSSSIETQSLFDLSQILDEFTSAVVEQIPADDAQSHYDMGMAFKDMGLWNEAIQAFETSSESEANRLNSLEMLAECYLQTERHEEAIRILEDLQQIADAATEARLYVQQGRAYEGLGKWDDAETAYALALEVDADLSEASHLLDTLGDRRERGAA